MTSDSGPIEQTRATSSSTFVDSLWKTYEDSLPDAIENLTSGDPLRASTWLEVLVPFVAAIFARGLEFEQRFSKRSSEFFFTPGRPVTAETLSHARLLEMQWLFAPICAASWLVVHAPEGISFITNDVGAAPSIRTNRDGSVTRGWSIPLSKSAVLFVTPEVVRNVMFLGPDGSWIADVRHATTSPEQVHEINRRIAAACRERIIGQDIHTVERYAQDATDHAIWDAETADRNFMEGWATVPAQIRHDHEHDWYVLVSIAHRDVTHPITLHLDDIDWAAIGRTGWDAPVFFDADQEMRRHSGVTWTREDVGRTWIGLDISGPTKPLPLKAVNGVIQGVTRTLTLEPVAIGRLLDSDGFSE